MTRILTQDEISDLESALLEQLSTRNMVKSAQIVALMFNELRAYSALLTRGVREPTDDDEAGAFLGYARVAYVGKGSPASYLLDTENYTQGEHTNG